MGSGIHNQKNREYIKAEQNFRAYKDRGGIGDRSTNFVELIGFERVSKKNFKYEGTFYVTEDGETYDKEYVDAHKPIRTGIKFYEVSNWIYNERKKIYEPIIRRIVMIKIKDTQLSLSL